MSKTSEAEAPIDDKKPALREGQRVRLAGLKACPELNGKLGKLLQFDEDKGRWQVKLKDSTKLLKADNLVPCDDAADDDDDRHGTTEQRTRDQASAEAEPRRPLPTKDLLPEEAVEWIQSSADEFELLLMPLQLEEDVGKIRKKFRSLSLLVHPDKNNHPDAENAFKKLFGAMEKLTDPVEQRVALRKARRRALGQDVSGTGDGMDLPSWWEAASVDEMEKAFREMEEKFQKMGLFDHDKRGWEQSTGVSEDELWISCEQAKDLLQRDLAFFVDARNTSDFQVSRAQGAYSLPGHTMEQLYGIESTTTFKMIVENPEQTVIIYSDNGSEMSRCIHVSRALRRSSRVVSHRVLRLRGGLNHWKRLGFPVDGDPRALFAGQVLGDGMLRLGGAGGGYPSAGGYS